MSPDILHLEITESDLMEDGPPTIETLQELASMGVRLALDDFGTGYSSMGYLKRFPVKFLKLDRSFVHGLEEEGSESRAILSAMIGLARALDYGSYSRGRGDRRTTRTVAGDGVRDGPRQILLGAALERSGVEAPDGSLLGDQG